MTYCGGTYAEVCTDFLPGLPLNIAHIVDLRNIYFRQSRTPTTRASGRGTMANAVLFIVGMRSPGEVILMVAAIVPI